MHEDLLRAIAGRRLVEFIYKVGRSRIVEPHDDGVRGGIDCLLAYQISGDSRSGAPHGWKQFELPLMHHLVLLDRHFAGSRVDAAQHHRVWDVLYARVS